MKKNEKMLRDLLLRGMVDSRMMATAAHAVRLPNQSTGLCMLCINGSNLMVWEVNFRQQYGDLIFSIPLNQIHRLKFSSFLFYSYLKFDYQDFHWKFTDLPIGRDFFETIRAEMTETNKNSGL